MTTETTPQTKNGHKAIMLPYDAIMAQVSEEIEKHIVDNGGSAYMVDFTTNVLLPAKASENAKDLQKQRNWAVAPEVKGIRLDDLANSLASNLGVNTRLGFPLCRDFVLALIEDKHGTDTFDDVIMKAVLRSRLLAKLPPGIKDMLMTREATPCQT